MFNDGLIDPEFPLYVEDITCDNLIKSGVVGSFIHNWDQPYRSSPGLLQDLLVNVPTAEIVAIDPFKNSAGVTKKTLYDAAGVRFFVPTFSENVEGALKYVNWLSKVENRSYLQIGDEGVTHELVDGVPKLIAAENEKIMNSGQNIDYTIMINGLDLGDEEKNKMAIASAYPFDADLIMKAYEDATTNGLSDPVIPVPLSAAGPVSQTLTDKGKTLMAEAITCAPEDFDSIWEAAIQDWLASGAQEVIDERAVAYDEYVGQ
jgi:putative aldouronate transport system substrate-binding protein